MTVLLVLSTLILFLATDFVVQRRRLSLQARALQTAGSESGLPLRLRLPSDLDLALNHVWIRRDARGVVTLGLDEFAARLLGAVEEILLPGPGASVAPSQAGIVLRDGLKRLELAVPLRGRVVSVNDSVRSDPSIIGRDPYERGWLLRLEADSRERRMPDTHRGTNAIDWLKQQTAAAREFLAGTVPGTALATMYDGGLPAQGVLRMCDDRVWKSMQQSFFTLPSTR